MTGAATNATTVASLADQIWQALVAAGDPVWRWHPGTDQFVLWERPPVGDEPARGLQAWLEAVHPQDRDRVRRALAGHAAGTEPAVRVEFRQADQGGEWLWKQLRGRAVGDGDQARGGPWLAGTIVDIADTHRAVAALQTSQALRHAVLQSALDPVVGFDEVGRIVEFNPAAERMFGRDRDDVIGVLVEHVIIPEHRRQAHLDDMARLRATGQADILNRRVETEAVRADGTLFPVEFTMVPVTAGGQKYYIATLRDITARTASEQERELLLQRYRKLAAKLTMHRLAVDHHAAVVVFDDKGRIVSGNDNFAIATARPLNELVGRGVRAIIESDGQGRANYEEILTTVRSSRAWKGELSMLAADGTRRWMSATIMPLPPQDDRLPEYMMVQTDISKLRQVEEQLRVAREREVSVGALIQQRLLVSASSPQMRGLDVSHFNRASQGIDGDFVEVFRSGEHSVDLIAGDVMGKGVSAALLSAAVKMQISRSFAELISLALRGGALPTPAEVVDTVHRTMTPHLQALEAFVTLSYVRLDLRNRKLQWVGCGHEEPLVVGVDGQTTLLPNQQPPLGVLAQVRFEQHERALARDDLVLVHSDGLIDALRRDGQRVGHDRLRAALARQAQQHRSAGAVLQTLMRDLLEGTSLVDDLTLVVARAGDAASGPTVVELPRRLDAVAAVRAFVDGQAAGAGVDEERAGLFTVAVVEAFTNVVRHATGVPEGAPVVLRALAGEGTLSIGVVYLGDAYAPPKVLQETNFDEYPEGGMGINIIRMACDRVEYEHHDGVNTTRLSVEPRRR